MKIAELKSVFAEWNPARLAAAEVDFKENMTPSFDAAQDDYKIVYEASFEPKSLEKGRLELWLSDESGVAVGIEHSSRITRRLKVRAFGFGGFVTGHEPGPVKIEAAKTLFEMVSRGNFAIKVASVFGLAFSAKALVAEITYNELVRCDTVWKDHSHLQPVKNLDQKAGPLSSILRYQPW